MQKKHQSKKTVQKRHTSSASTTPNFQINRFEKLEKIMNQVSAHQTKKWHPNAQNNGELN